MNEVLQERPQARCARLQFESARAPCDARLEAQEFQVSV